MTLMIEANKVTKKFSDLDALKDFHLEVRKGECVGLLGPNGAGKSTFIGTTYGIVRRSSGELKIFGLDPNTHARQIKQQLGVVTQENALDESLSVQENLELYAAFEGMNQKTARLRIAELLEFLNAEHKRNSTIQTLSGGMKRRLVFIRALLPNPQLVILDEPTTGLDPAVRQLLWAKVKDLKSKGVTVVLTTHYMHEAEILCDRVLIMNKGTTVAEGQPKELIQKYVPGFVALFSDSSRETIRMPTLESLSAHCKAQNLLPDLIRPANLEDVFLKLTGQGLSEDA